MMPTSSAPRPPRFSLDALLDTLTSGKVILGLVAVGFLAFVGAVSVWLSQGEAPPQAAPIPTSLTPAATLELPPRWDGKERINVLLLGVDDRPWDPNWGPPRADTLIVLTLDPKTMSGGAISLPRDLWVNLPGIGERKINQAYSLSIPLYGREGAARYTANVVGNLLQIPIHHYAVVNFQAFIVFVDAIYGVKIDVPKRMALDVFKANGERFAYPLYPGRQVLSGSLALAYARDRGGPEGDFGRMRRQQQVLEAVLERLKNPRILGELALEAPALVKQLQGSLITDIPVGDALRLARLAADVPREKIHFAVITQNEATATTHWENGVAVYALDPDVAKILAVRDRVFSPEAEPTPTPYPWPSSTAGASAAATSTRDAPPSPTPQPDTQKLAAALQENPVVLVQNGTDTRHLACRTATLLQQWGFQHVATGNADENYTATMLLEYTARPHTLAFLQDLFGVPDSRVRYLSAASPPADIVVVLGQDWADGGQVSGISCTR